MEWSEKEIQIMYKYQGVKTLKEVAEIVGRTKVAVKHKAERLGIKYLSEKDYWSEDEEFYLKNNIKYLTYKQLAKKLNRTVCSVKKKVYSMGISETKQVTNKPWSESEVAYIERNYSIYPASVIAKKLNRSVSAVKHKASRLRVNGIYQNTITFSVLASCFDVSYSTVRRWAKEFNMPYKVVNRGDIYLYDIDVGKFWEWAEKHKELICWNKYSRNSLPPEPYWIGVIKKNHNKEESDGKWKI